MSVEKPTQLVRENRAFYNAAGDPHLFPTDVFVGRAAELRTLRGAIDTVPSRLVTVVGPAGVGKTRLALEAVRTADERYAGGAIVVRLAAIGRVEGIIPEIARALGMVDQAEKLDGLVREILAVEPTVLLFDCVEHLIPTANELIAGLLRDCPPLRIVLTSRRPSGLPGEWRLELQPLAVATDDSTESALRSDAVQLFIDRARKARPWFTLQDGDAEIINQLCVRYDGLPLAIELMASWMTVLSPKELLDWEPERLEFRTPVADPRHQSLLDAIAWSYGLLKPDKQALLCRLSIFTGGFSRDLVEAMARGREAGAGYPYADGYGFAWPWAEERGFDPTQSPWDDQNPDIARALSALSPDPVRILATLVDHHLVYQTGEIDGVPRFDMLEAVREFGRRQLERTGELETVQHAHAAVMIAFSEATAEGLWSHTRREWSRERVDADLQNIRLAIDWANVLGNDGAEIAARIAGPLWPYWQTRGMVTEGRRYLDACLFRPTLKPWFRSKELPALAFLCWIQGDDARCQEVVDAALIVTTQEGADFANQRGTIYLVMALMEFRKGMDHVFTMLEYAEEAERLYKLVDDPVGLGACHLIFGQVCRFTGQTDRALELFETAFKTHEAIGYEWGAAAGRYFAAEATRDLAETDATRIPETVALLHDALDRFWGMGDFWGTGGAMSGLACILALRHDDLKAATYFGAAQVLMGRVGGALLPSELMTHHETEAAIQARMPEAVWREAFTLGKNAPDLIVEQALIEFADPPAETGTPTPLPRLTRTQQSVVQDLAQGYDVPRIAQRRGRSTSATYELVDRILERLGLTDRDELAAYAVKTGLVNTSHPRSGSVPPN